MNHVKKCSLRCAFLVSFKSLVIVLPLTVVRDKNGPDAIVNHAKTVAHFVRAASCMVRILRIFVLAALEQKMRGTGFEPADPYGTAS